MNEIGFPIGTFRTVFAWLCHYIYWFISNVFQLFINVSKVSTLSDDKLRPIYQRVTLILVIIMVFYVTLEFVKYIVQPDTLTDKEKGASNILTKCILVVVLIALVPNVFLYAYKVQNAIIEKDVFSRIILGYGSNSVSEKGNEFAYSVLRMFYWFDEEKWGEDASCGQGKCKAIVEYNYKSLLAGDGVPNLDFAINAADTKPVGFGGNQTQVLMPKISFSPLFAVLVGLFIAYILVLYTIDIGARVVQLLFLQIIAPIPIIGYLSPKKDNIFQKWVKQCVTTYLDLFIRLLIIYFILFLCDELLKTSSLLNNVPTNQHNLVLLVLVLGLLMFAHRAPKMLQELFPKLGAASGTFGLKPGDRPGISRAIGAALGATTGLRTMAARGINRVKRNKFNKEYRQGAKEDYDTALKNYQTIRGRRKNLSGAKYDKGTKTYRYEYEKGKYKNLSEKEYADLMKNTRKEERDALVERDSAKAYMENTRYRSALGAAAAGLVGGTVRGAATGAKLSKIEKFGDVTKQMREVENNENAKTAAVEKWYEEGGYSTPSRILSGVEQKVGVTTSYGRMRQEIQKLDSSIKSNERLIATEGDVKTKEDAAKNRSASKIESGEQKTKIAAGFTFKFKDLNGVEQTRTVTSATTTSGVYFEYKQKAESAKANAEAAAQAVQSLETARIREMAKGTWTNADQSALDQAKANYALLDEQSKIANDEQGKVKKAMQEYAITDILQGTADYQDAVLRQNVADTRTSVLETTRDEKTRKAVERQFALMFPNDPARRDELIKLYNDIYMTGNADLIKNYKDLDDIQTALINSANDRTRENVTLKGDKSRLEASSYYDAAKSDDTAAGGGKK